MVGDAFADALDLDQPRRRRRQHLGEAAEAGEQGLGDRLGVDAGKRLEEDQFEQFVVAEIFSADFIEALAHTLAMLEIVGKVPAFLAKSRHLPLRGGNRPFGDRVKIS